MGYSVKDLKDDIGDVVMCPEGKNFLKAVSGKMQDLVHFGMDMASLLATDISRCDCTDAGDIVMPSGETMPRMPCTACKARAYEITRFSNAINNPLLGEKGRDV